MHTANVTLYVTIIAHCWCYNVDNRRASSQFMCAKNLKKMVKKKNDESKAFAQISRGFYLFHAPYEHNAVNIVLLHCCVSFSLFLFLHFSSVLLCWYNCRVILTQRQHMSVDMYALDAIYGFLYFLSTLQLNQNALWVYFHLSRSLFFISVTTTEVVVVLPQFLPITLFYSMHNLAPFRFRMICRFLFTHRIIFRVQFSRCQFPLFFFSFILFRAPSSLQSGSQVSSFTTAFGESFFCRS